MANKFFIDSDVIIDLLINRQPFSNEATIIFDLAEKNQIELYTSALCINNVHYIIKKIIGDKKARDIINDLIEILGVLEVTKTDIKNAVKSDFKDFEDAVQHSVALSNENIHAIVTRNLKDFTKSRISVLSPENVLQILKYEK